MFSLSHLLAFVVLAVALIAAITDTRTGLIPNWLTLPALLAAPLAHFAFGGSEALQDSLLGAGVCAFVPMTFFSRRALGGGDLKLFVALGALAGMHVGLSIQLLAFAIGACWALVVLAYRGELRATLARTVGVIMGVVGRVPTNTVDAAQMTSLRLGASIFAATLIVLTTELGS
jgi:prepilin peptidase CpaA